MKIFEYLLVPLYLLAFITGYIYRPIVVGFQAGCNHVLVKDQERANKIAQERMSLMANEEVDRFEQIEKE